MASDVEKSEQLAVSEEEKAQLTASLLDSLPSIPFDQDDGIAEALRRDAGLEAHPEQAISFEELDTIRGSGPGWRSGTSGAARHRLQGTFSRVTRS